MNVIDFLCIAGGFAWFGGIFVAGFYGEQARIAECNLAYAGGVL